MRSFVHIVGHYMDLLDSTIGRCCDAAKNTKASSNVNTKSILDIDFAEGSSVFINIGKVRLDEVLLPLVERICSIGLKLNKSTSMLDIYKFCTYCALSTNVLSETTSDINGKMAEPNTVNKVAELAIKFQESQNFPSYHQAQKHAQNLFKALGKRNSIVLDSLVATLKKQIAAKDESPTISKTLKAITALASTLDSLNRALQAILPCLSNLNKNYYNTLSQSISNMIYFAVKSSPESFIAIFPPKDDSSVQQIDDFQTAELMISILNSWDIKDNWFVRGAQLALTLLLQKAVADKKYDDIFSKFANVINGAQSINPTLENAISGFKSGFYLLSSTSSNQIFGMFTNNIYEMFMQIIENHTIAFLACNDQIQRIIFVDFALAYYNYNKKAFTERFLECLKSTIPANKGRLVSRFINRICRYPPAVGFDPLVVQMVAEMIDSLNGDQGFMQHLRFLFKAFNASPEFFEALLGESIPRLALLIEVASQSNLTEFCDAMNSFFDPARVSDLSKNEKMWEMISTAMKGITKLMTTTGLYVNTAFVQLIPELVLRISQFVLVAVQNTDESTLPADHLESILTDIETTALVLMNSSSSDRTKTAVSIISNLLGSTHHAKLYEQIPMPLEAYQTLVTSCRGRSTVLAMHPYVVASLKLVKGHSKGMTAAWGTIYEYFVAILRTLAPNSKFGDAETEPQTVQKTSELLHEELPNSFSLMMSLLPAGRSDVIEQVHAFLHDGDFIGQMAVDCLPSALLPAFYQSIAQIIQKEIADMQTQPNVFEVTPENSTYIQNTMRVVRNLLKQTLWDEASVDVNVITQIAVQFTSYCNLVSLSDYHVLCSSFLIMLVSRYSTEINNTACLTMANTLSMWLSRPDRSRRGKNAAAIIFEALGQLLDGLEFFDEEDPRYMPGQSLDKFSFFVNCALTAITTMPDLRNDIQKMLTSLFRNNINTGIEHCISHCLSSALPIRTTILAALASVLKKPAAVSTSTKESEKEQSFIDVLFETKFQLIEASIDLVAFSRAEAFGVNLLEAAVTKNIHYDFIDFMVRMELRTAHEASKNAIFRGNGVASRAVGHFPRLFGTDWMTKNLKPLFDEVIEAAEHGAKYQINPKKLGPDDDLEGNRARFRAFMEKVVDTILNAFKTIPRAIIRVIQILYHRINERFEGMGIQILFGFLLLRFVLPPFSVPHLIGLPSLLPDEPRNCLVTSSVILMASVTKGNLDEKGEHMAIFNDIAARVKIELEKCIVELTKFDLQDAELEQVKIDEEKVITNLTKDFSAMRRSLETKINELPESDSVRQSAQRLLEIVAQTNVKEESSTANSDSTAENSPKYVKLMGRKFSSEPLTDLFKWFFKETTQLTDNPVFYCVNSSLPRVNDLAVLPFHIFKTLRGVRSEYSIIADMQSFDKSQVPRVAQIVKYIDAAPKTLRDNLKAIYVVNASHAFVQFLIDNQKQLPLKKIVFAQDTNTFREKFPGLKPRLSPLAIESLTIPESIHAAKLNNTPIYVRLHEHSVQIMRTYTALPQADAHSLTVITFEHIRRIAENQTGFVLQTDEENFAIVTTTGSNLYALLVAAVDRAKQKNSTTRVAVDKTSVQWLMLNIAFANLASTERDVSLNIAAFQLVLSIFASFDFNRTRAPVECPPFLIPPNCTPLVASLSQDIADQNPAGTASFLSEFFKMVERLPEGSIENTIPFLAPWIENMVNNEDGTDDLLQQVLSFYFTRTSIQSIFNAIVWIRIKEEKAMLRMFEILKRTGTKNSLRLVNYIAQLNPEVSSRYWVAPLEEGPFACNVLHSLLMADVFDHGMAAELLYKLIIHRDSFSQEMRGAAGKLLNNLFANLALHGRKNAGDAISEAVQLYEAEKEEEFERWVSQLSQLLGSIARILDSLDAGDLKLEILKRLRSSLGSGGYQTKYVGPLLCTIFSHSQGGNSEVDDEALAKEIMKTLSFGDDDANILLCHALAPLKLSSQVRSRLVLAAVVMLVSTCGQSGLVLLNSAADPESVQFVKQGVPKEAVQRIGELAKLPLVERPVFSLGVLVAAFDEWDVCGEMVERFQGMEAVMKVLSVGWHEERVSEIEGVDFGEDWRSAAAIGFGVFMRHPGSDAVFRMVQGMIDRNTEAFGCFTGYQEMYRKQVIPRIGDPLKVLMFGKITLVPRTYTTIAPLLQMLYSEKGFESLIGEGDRREIIGQLFPAK